MDVSGLWNGPRESSCVQAARDLGAVVPKPGCTAESPGAFFKHAGSWAVSGLPKTSLEEGAHTRCSTAFPSNSEQLVRGLAFGNPCLGKHLMQLPCFSHEKTETQKSCELCSDPRVDLKSLCFQRLYSREGAFRVRF